MDRSAVNERLLLSGYHVLRDRSDMTTTSQSGTTPTTQTLRRRMLLIAWLTAPVAALHFADHADRRRPRRPHPGPGRADRQVSPTRPRTAHTGQRNPHVRPVRSAARRVPDADPLDVLTAMRVRSPLWRVCVDL